MSKKWSAQVQFPTDSCFVNRIISATFGPSNSSGNPMITLECEVIAPQEYEVGGEMVTIAGVKTKNYYVTSVNGDTEKTERCRKSVEENLFSKLGITDVNWDNIDTKPLLGKCILTMMNSEEEERRKTPTSVQIAEAKAKNVRPMGDIMKNPMTGKPLVNYWPKVVEIFGEAPEGSY